MMQHKPTETATNQQTTDHNTKPRSIPFSPSSQQIQHHQIQQQQIQQQQIQEKIKRCNTNQRKRRPINKQQITTPNPDPFPSLHHLNRSNIIRSNNNKE